MAAKTENPSPLQTLAGLIQPSEPVLELDATDTQLLIELSKDARIPQRKLAEMLGMSSPAVADRIARLKQRGVLRGFSVDINWDKLGNSTVAYLSISAATGHYQSVVISELIGVRGIEEISLVTGTSDLLVKIRARGIDDLRAILANEVWRIDGIQQTATSIALMHVQPENNVERMLRAMSNEAL